MRLTVPCRAVTCSHLQCFDAALYLQMNEKKPTWICPVCDKKADYENLIIDGLFLEILNDCSDVDEIKFQEDGTWCPMRPKKDAVKVSVHSVGKVESTIPLQQSLLVADLLEPSFSKKVDVIDLTLESSSSSDDGDDTITNPPTKRPCIYLSKNEDIHGNGTGPEAASDSSPMKLVLTSYQPSVGIQNLANLEQSYLTSAIAEYAVPFHPSTLASIPTEVQSLDLFSLIQSDPQHYRPQMYLENLSGSMQCIPSTSSALVSSTSNNNCNASGNTPTSIPGTRVVAGGRGCTGEVAGDSLSDIISLD